MSLPPPRDVPEENNLPTNCVQQKLHDIDLDHTMSPKSIAIEAQMARKLDAIGAKRVRQQAATKVEIARQLIATGAKMAGQLAATRANMTRRILMHSSEPKTNNRVFIHPIGRVA